MHFLKSISLSLILSVSVLAKLENPKAAVKEVQTSVNSCTDHLAGFLFCEGKKSLSGIQKEGPVAGDPKKPKSDTLKSELEGKFDCKSGLSKGYIDSILTLSKRLNLRTCGFGEGSKCESMEKADEYCKAMKKGTNCEPMKECITGAINKAKTPFTNELFNELLKIYKGSPPTQTFIQKIYKSLSKK